MKRRDRGWGLEGVPRFYVGLFGLMPIIGPSSNGRTPVFGTGGGGSNPPGPTFSILPKHLAKERLPAARFGCCAAVRDYYQVFSPTGSYIYDVGFRLARTP